MTDNCVQVASIYFASVIFYLAGFILWNLDNLQCPALKVVTSNINRDADNWCQFAPGQTPRC